MQGKLQELTERLYNEGLSKGKQEGEFLLASARKEADAILAGARREAEQILATAQKDALDLKSKAETDIKMASEQCLSATKKDIENLIVDSISSKDIEKGLSNPVFLKQIIEQVAAKFSAEESTDLSLVLPASLQKELEPWVKGQLTATLSKGVTAEFSKKIAGGFTIGPKDGSWFVSLTDETFKALIAEYLRPVTRKILFG